MENFSRIINNKKSIILNENNRILSFIKNTSQPKVENFLKTKIINNRVVYDNHDFEILPNYYNIFSVLYIIMSGGVLPKDFTIEREWLLYNSSIQFKEDKAMYILDLKEKKGYNPMIVHTDIFTWAVFLEGAQRKIFIDKKTKMIERCVFSKGLTFISAELIEPLIK